MAAFSMTDSQHVPLSLTFVDKKGNPVTTPTGIAVTWTTDNPLVLDLTPSADGFTCDVAAVGPLGSAGVTVNVADAQGNALAAGLLTMTITSGAPSTVNIVPGTPVEE